MNRADQRHIEETVIRIAAERGGVLPDTLSRPTHFRNDLEFDSLDFVEMTMELEDEFEMSIPDAEAEPLQTVGDVVDYIARRTAQTPAGA